MADEPRFQFVIAGDGPELASLQRRFSRLANVRFVPLQPEARLAETRATLSLSLLLHELSTNALKYGALSSDAGRIRVSWRVENTEGRQHLILSWLETGGPPPVAPTHRGFGSKLIEMGLMGTGGVDLRYNDDGLEVVFTAPLDEMQLS